ncbi:hypothetical protein JCM17844_13910 [Iodidimonas gelatinilytica]|uniref:Uncharacterized protein n=1 Tax=Iodidimonas gelatinilytica TaxID=1236966 RepID=A0A5A7MQ52_9PROT|nr:hypothetical protein JCM17844_13910 [Iodidimonas gelatinilytica]GER01022.1 hypothetical protein JCM17845_16450 [Iodidimonas gelatinilytica]
MIFIVIKPADLDSSEAQHPHIPYRNEHMIHLGLRGPDGYVPGYRSLNIRPTAKGLQDLPWQKTKACLISARVIMWFIQNMALAV